MIDKYGHKNKKGLHKITMKEHRLIRKIDKQIFYIRLKNTLSYVFWVITLCLIIGLIVGIATTIAESVKMIVNNEFQSSNSLWMFFIIRYTS